MGWNVEVSRYKLYNELKYLKLKHRSISVVQVTCSNPEAAGFVALVLFGLRASGSLKFFFFSGIKAMMFH